MKIIVQIPCLNEEKTIASTIRSVPRRIAGIDTIEVLIVDDGSSDQTVSQAKSAGADHLIVLPHTQGLAHAFMAGIEESLKRKADIIINLDADHQYNAEDIPKLIRPILDGRADIVIGERQFDRLAHFSFLKKQLQQLGSRAVSLISGVTVKDAVSGFRAFSQAAALRIELRSRFSHTLETIIFAAREKIPIACVPVTTNPTARPSRLAPNTWDFVKKSVASLIRAYVIYEPFKFFLSVGSFFLLVGFVPIVKFLFFYFSNHGNGHIQSLVIGSLLISLGFICIAIGLIADLLSMNRMLIEKQMLENKKARLHLS